VLEAIVANEEDYEIDHGSHGSHGS
jgi:hypothetical protein